MACPFILAAIRNEAETYFAHGLHQEASAAYDRLLANAKEIHPALRSTIEEAKRRIDSAAMAHDLDEDTRISDAEMTCIKKSWANYATTDELAVSARALMDLGRYGHALEEYRRLILKGRRTRTAIGGVTTCLLHLIGPTHFSKAVNIFVKGVFRKPKNRLLLKLLIAKYIDPHKYPHQLSSLHRHLTRIHPVSDEIQTRIRALGRIVQDAAAAISHDDAYGPLANLNGLCRHLDPRDPKRKT